MASVTCIYCHAENEQGEQLCRGCFRKLPAEPLVPSPAEPSPTSDARRQPDPPDQDLLTAEVPGTCPHCDAEVPDPDNRVCVECHRTLARPGPLRLSFPGGDVTVDAAGSVRLGRDPARSPVWEVFAEHDNVSRLHATVGVDDQGAWVRDERSLNGTYVNDVPVAPGARITLADGDTLRLAADVTATVEQTTIPPSRPRHSAER